MKWRALSVVAVILMIGLLMPLLANAKSRDEKNLEKIRGDNLSGLVLVPKVNAAPGALPYDPLEGVEVKVEGTKHKAVTDSYGCFHFKLKPGTYKLVLTKAGMGMITKEVTVSNGPTPTMIKIRMAPGSMIIDGHDFSNGGNNTYVAPGTAYVAFAKKPAPGAPAGSSPKGGYGVSTTQSYRQMIMMGGTGDPFSMGGGNVTIPATGDIGSDAFRTAQNVAPNSLMMVTGENPGQPAYKELACTPYWVTFNAAGSRCFISTSDKQIQVYDSANDNNLMTSIPAGGIVTDLKLSQDGNYVLATVLSSASNILMIDPRTNAPQRSVPVPAMRTGQAGRPSACAVNREGTRLYVAQGTANSGEVVAVDLYTGIPQAAVAVGSNPSGLELSPDGRFLYCVNSGSGDVSVIDAWTFAEMGRVRVGVNPQKVCITPDGARVFVTNKGSDTVTVLNGQNQAPLATVPVGKNPIGIAVANDGSKVFVCCTGSGNVNILDGSTGGVISATTPLANSVPWGVCVRP